MIVLSLILAHFIADFYLQTEKMVNDKKKYLMLHLFHHFLITLITLAALFFVKDFSDFFYTVIALSILIVVLHGLIDWIKIFLQEKVMRVKQRNGLNLILFVGDQVLHLIAILVACHFLLDVDFNELFENILIALQLKDGIIADKTLAESTLFILIMFILITSVTGHFIKIMLGSLTKHLSLFEGKYTLRDVAVSTTSQKSLSEEYTYMVMKHQDLSRGKVIGYLERLLVVALILMGSFPAVGFIVAAKSLTRFKQMDDRDWAEYFLLGTLTSFLFAIVYGIILKIIFFS
jgi:hypothetical protein